MLVTVALHSLATLEPLLASLAAALAFKVVKEAFGRVALLVTLVIDVVPAAEGRGAVGPRVLHGEGTVAPIPLARVAVAGLIANTVSRFVSTILAQAGSRGGVVGGSIVFTVVAPECRWALARVIGRVALRATATPILAGATSAARFTVLGVGAEATGSCCCVDTLLPSSALHLSTSALASCPRETLQKSAKKEAQQFNFKGPAPLSFPIPAAMFLGR